MAEDSKLDSRPRDRELFLEYLAMHEAQLLGFLSAVVRNFQDAEDIFQQTVMTMWQKFADFEPGTSFVAWGCQIGRFHAANHLRSNRALALDDHVLELLATTQEEQEPELRLARRRALSGCIEKLAAADRELVQAAYSGESTISSIAEHLGRSSGGVYNSLARIRSGLYRCIEATVARESSG